MTNEDKRFKIEKIEKSTKDIKDGKLLSLFAVGGLVFLTYVTFNLDNISIAQALIFAYSYVCGVKGLAIANEISSQAKKEKDNITTELEEQGIDVKEELKIRKRTK